MKTIKYLSMAALALVGAVLVGCSSDDNIIDEPQQPASKDNVVTLTTTVSLDGAETRALNATGVKTFAAGETMALVYKSGTSTKKAESHELIAGDITNEGKSATFTFDLEDPNRSGDVTYIYPAAMANADGSVNYAALNSQGGTLASLASNLDLATYTDSWNNDGSLPPTVTLDNKLAILALTLKNDAGGSNITSSITGMTIKEGSNTYAISGISSASTIYVAINPTSSANLEITATDGTKTYAKALSGKTYAANNGYNVTWRMAEVISGKFSVSSTKQVYFSKGNLRATTTNKGSSWTWAFATNQWDKVGATAANTSITANKTVSTNGTVDLFGWSTDATYLGINKTNSNNAEFEGTFKDWGKHDDVIANIGSGWRTLTGGEWDYLFKKRSTTSGKYFCKAKVGDCFGVILLPDDWSTDYYILNNCNETDERNFDDTNINNKISTDDWTSKLEAHGAVFLPCAGQRNGGNVVNAPNGQVHYWSASKGTTDTGSSANANHVRIDGTGVFPNTGGGRCNGFSVRLVRDVK